MATITHPNGIAPTEAGTYRLGAKGGRMAKAWQFIWDRFDGGWKDGLKLAQEAAGEFDLKPISISEMLCRMRAAGVIEQEMIEAPTQYVRGGKTFFSNRKRVHYRINREFGRVDR
jgi:hypothetical protein